MRTIMVPPALLVSELEPEHSSETQWQIQEERHRCYSKPTPSVLTELYLKPTLVLVVTFENVIFDYS